MSQPLKESPQANFVHSQPTAASKLYTILKAEDAAAPLVLDQSKPPGIRKTLATSGQGIRHRQSGARFPHEWQCWQCQRVCQNEDNLALHLMGCKYGGKGDSILPGCPFCPRDLHHTSIQPFTICAFNSHVASCHSEITQLACAYCLKFMLSPRVEELASHVLQEHHIPWRPSPGKSLNGLVAKFPVLFRTAGS